MITLDELLKPIAGESPSGPDLSDKPEFDELETLLKGKPEIEIGSIRKPAEPPDWGELERKSGALLLKGKHLRVAIMYCCGLLRTGGLPGFRDGLQFIRSLLEQQWATVHPLLDKEDNDDPTYRLNILGSLTAPRGSVSGWLTVIDYLYSAPLVAPRGAPPVTFDLLLSARGAKPEDGSSSTVAPLLGAIATVLRANADKLAVQIQALQESLDAIKGLDQFLTSTLSAGKTMSFDELEKNLKDMIVALQPYQPAAGAEAGGAAAATETAGAEASAALSISGAVRSREDVVRALDAVCLYYQQVEPGSPIPYLLRRAQKMATMNFVEMMKELNLANVDALRPSMGGSLDEQAGG